MRPSRSTRGRKHWTPARIGTYAFLVSAALFFLLPLYVMLVTSFKPMEEIRLGALFALPQILFVSAGIEVDPARKELGDGCHDLVQEPPVVGDGQYGASEVFQPALKPLHALCVKMVRRLV